MAGKGIEHYLANPDEIPEDLSELSHLMDGESTDPAPAEDKPTEPTSTPEPKKDETPAPSSQEPKQEQAEEVPAPIASKDGKHTIPYAVLATEREKRMAAEKLVQDLNDRMRDIEAKMAAGENVKAEQQEVVDLMSEESTQDILADFPSLKPLVEYTKKLEGQVTEFQKRFEQVERNERQRHEQEAARAAQEVRAEIDANPYLRYWEAKDQERWQAAVEADAQLRQMPINRNLSMRERFEKVVGVVDAIYGKTELPPEFKPAAPAKPDLTEKVKEAIESAAPVKPKTIGEMPGGTPSKGDELEELLSRSSQELGAKLEAMSPDAIKALLNRIG